VSFDGGDHWLSLQLNLPAASVRDLDVHSSDLVAATFGRALWVLDDVTPLRQTTGDMAAAKARLYAPQTATRVRWDVNQDTPLPAETPAGANPPDGAIVYYYLKSPVSDVRLDIYDARGALVRSFSSTPEKAPKLPPNAPEYWFADEPALSTQAGLNRFVWDLRYQHPETLPYGYYGNLLGYVEYTLPDHAIPGETPRYQPLGALVAPGEYKLVLTAGDASYSQNLTVKPDPRVQVTQPDLEAQLSLALSIAAQMKLSASISAQLTGVQAELAARKQALPADNSASDAAKAIQSLANKARALDAGRGSKLGFGLVNRDLARLITMVESADMRPSESAVQAVADLCVDLNKDLASWRESNATDIPALNLLLQKYKIDPVKPAAQIPADVSCPK
ncbi:MAG TPA: hypothetical protein VLZ81_02505, partial [Blastocatellia bacterium]|nr:hypothetical protein [Blastocatellia bacterium]